MRVGFEHVPEPEALAVEQSGIGVELVVDGIDHQRVARPGSTSTYVNVDETGSNN